MSEPGVYERYAKDIEDYLISKFPDVPRCDLNEIAIFITHKTALFMFDRLEERDREWKQSMKMSASRYRKKEKQNESL